MALAIFAFTYLFIAGSRVPGLSIDRPGGALLGAAAMVAAKVVLPSEVKDAVDVDTIVLLLGMMMLSHYLTLAGFFERAAHAVLHLAHAPGSLLWALIFISAALSAFLVNDTVCLMLTPLVLAITEKAALKPAPYLLALCMAANAGSSATFTGNPQNMLIAGVSGQSYGTFAAALALPALVATVVVGAIIWLTFRRDLQRRSIAPDGPAPAVDHRLLAITLAVLTAVVAAFFAGAPMAWSALSGAAVVMVFSRRAPREALERNDYLLLLFFACLFIVVFGVHKAGWSMKTYQLFEPFVHGSWQAEVFGFSALSLLASNVFSNVPYVMLARHWVPSMSDQPLAWQTLALSSTLAGNLTLVGSIANLIVFEGARGKVQMGFWQYAKVGVPATLLSLALGLLVLVVEHRFF